LPGDYDSADSRAAYWALIGKLEKGEPIDGESKPAAETAPSGADGPGGLTVAELIERYRIYAESYYRQHGELTGEHLAIKYSVRPLLNSPLCAVLASEFRPRHLKEVRQAMIALGWTRRHINACVRRINRMFVWAAGEELIDEGVAGALKMVKPILEGRDPAVQEKDEVTAVEKEVVDQIMPHLSQVAADAVRFMLHTGCRPGEFGKVTVEGIDKTDPECWTCELKRHKTAHKKRRRVLLFDPRCQALMRPWIVKAGAGRVFPIKVSSLQTAIARACKKAGVPRFGPNALRHTAGTEARKHGGLEAAQALLGHSTVATTQRYAEVDVSKARSVIKAIG
jgi:integrase